MENKEIVREGYNTIASKYLEAREEAVREKRSEDLLLLEDLVQRLPKGAKVLDAGCGSGVPVTRFLSQSLEVIGSFPPLRRTLAIASCKYIVIVCLLSSKFS